VPLLAEACAYGVAFPNRFVVRSRDLAASISRFRGSRQTGDRRSRRTHRSTRPPCLRLGYASPPWQSGL